MGRFGFATIVLVSVLLSGCASEPPAEAVAAADAGPAPEVLTTSRAVEEQEYEGRLPATVEGVSLTEGESGFVVDSERVPGEVIVEIELSDEMEPTAYELIFRAEGREHALEMRADEPFVFHLGGLRFPYEFEIRALEPDLVPSSWRAKATFFEEVEVVLAPAPDAAPSG